MSDDSKDYSELFHIGNKFANKTLWPSVLETSKQGETHKRAQKLYTRQKRVDYLDVRSSDACGNTLWDRGCRGQCYYKQ